MPWGCTSDQHRMCTLLSLSLRLVGMVYEQLALIVQYDKTFVES